MKVCGQQNNSSLVPFFLNYFFYVRAADVRDYEPLLVQRKRGLSPIFYFPTFSWCRLNWYLIAGGLSDDDAILIAGDETTVTKSGKHTYGLGRYFSSIFNRALPSRSFFTLSLISVQRRPAFPIIIEQVTQEEEEPPAVKTVSSKKKKKPGRPKGSRNKTQSTPQLSPRLLWIPALLRNLLRLIGTRFKPVYFVYDSALGNNDCTAMLKPLE